ncbi:DDE superfamily endonuclease [Popillia japonica]|uniref:DDE superfamily endonuclease n=1 Tax=Popillia japonica TaxID=7064 RepID=A0AAW1I8M1_POPJA
MEQNVIQNIKTSYRKSLLVHILSEDTDIKDGLKNLNMRDVVYWLAESWKSCSVNLIKKSWHPLWVSPEQYEWEEEDNLSLSQWIQTQDNEDVLTPLIIQIYHLQL